MKNRFPSTKHRSILYARNIIAPAKIATKTKVIINILSWIHIPFCSLHAFILQIIDMTPPSPEIQNGRNG